MITTTSLCEYNQITELPLPVIENLNSRTRAYYTRISSVAFLERMRDSLF